MTFPIPNPPRKARMESAHDLPSRSLSRVSRLSHRMHSPVGRGAAMTPAAEKRLRARERKAVIDAFVWLAFAGVVVFTAIVFVLLVRTF